MMVVSAAPIEKLRLRFFRANITRVLQINMVFLIMAGAWVGEGRVTKRILVISRYLAYVLLLMAVVGSAIECYLKGDDLTLVTFALATIACGVSPMSKLMILVRHSKEIKEILWKLEIELIAKFEITEEEKKFLKESERTIATSAITFILITFAGAVSWIGSPLWGWGMAQLGLIKAVPEIGLPFPIWSPYDISDRKIFVITYAVHLVSGSYMWWCWVGTDLLLAGIIMHICGHFRIISERISNKEALMLKDEEEYSSDADREKRYYESLIEYHVQMLSLGQLLENIYRPILFILLMAVTAVIGCCGFQVIVGKPEQASHVTASIIVLINMISSWYVCCYFGMRLKTDSEKVGKALYFTEWHNLPADQRKLLLFMLQRSQIPASVSAGKFYKLTLRSYLDMLKTSYSFLAVLNEIAN